MEEYDSDDQLLYTGAEFHVLQVVLLQNGPELRPEIKLDGQSFTIFGYQRFRRDKEAAPYKRLELIPHFGGRLVVLTGSAHEDVDTTLDYLDIADATPVLALGSTTPLQLQDWFASPIDIRAFGAIGDGVADDTAAIQAAINAAAPGETVLCPPGVYLLSAQLNLATGVTLAGAGIGATTFRVKAGTQIRAIVAQNTNDWVVRDLSIDTNKANTANAGSTANQQAIYALATAAAGIVRGRIENVHCLNGWQYAINLASQDLASPGTWPVYVDIVRCRVEGYNIGIEADRAVGPRILETEISGSVSYGINVNRCQKFLVRGCDCHDNGGNGIVANTDARDFQIIGNRSFNNGGLGIVASVNAQRFVIEGNRCDQNTDSGISIDVKKLDVNVPTGSLVRAANVVTATVANSYLAGDTVYLKAHADSANFPVGTKVIITATAANFTYNEVGANAASANATSFVGTAQVPVDGIVANNVTSRSATKHGIYAQFLSGLVISGNESFGNALSGIYVTALKSVLITGNVARNNGGYGIGVSEPTIASQTYLAPSSDVRVIANHTPDNTNGGIAQDAVLTGTGTPIIFYDGFAVVVPASGFWNKSVRLWNAAPAGGAAMGWIRVTDGSANVLGVDWKAMPNL